MVRTEIDSMPTELDEISRKIMQLEIEEAALKKETAEDLFYRRGAQRAPISLPIRSVRYFADTHAVKSTQARHTRVARIVYGCWWLGPIR